MLPDREFVTLVIASLLHGINQFLPGAHDPAVREVAARLSGVVDPDLLRTLTLRHDQNDQPDAQGSPESEAPRAQLLSALLDRAIALSVGQAAQPAGGWVTPPGSRLALVFDRVYAGDLTGPRNQLKAQPLVEPGRLTDEIFPVAWQDQPNEASAGPSREFAERCRQVLSSGPTDPVGIVSHLLALLSRYTWATTAPSADTASDTSLFDHLKVTTALASCLYLVHHERGTLVESGLSEPGPPELCLLTGDFSGIQNYIFDITTGDDPGRGIARRLRARSFAIQTLSEAIPHSFLEAAGLPPTNLILSSGGKFMVLVPNLDSILERLRQVAGEWNRWLLDQYRGELSLNLAWTPFGADELLPGPGRGFGRLSELAAGQLAQEKTRTLAWHLLADGRWRPDAFLMPALAGAPCTSCQKFAARREGLCGHCQADLEWGRLLPRATGLALFGRPETGERSIGPASASLVTDRDTQSAPDLLIRLNDPNTERHRSGPVAFRYVVSHVPTGPAGDPATFEEIAATAIGRPLLGFLKLDVDRLGELFAFGLRGRDTIARMATLSRTLDLFFTGWVERLLEAEFATCYAVFSGGDDVFVVGPWDRALALGLRLADDFDRYTGRNPHLSISGGLVLGTDHYPIGQAAREADRLVHRSKLAGGGRFTLEGQTLPWAELRRVVATWEELRPDLSEVSQGFLHALVAYGDMCQRRDLRLQPLLAYTIAREQTTPAFRRWAAQFIGIRPLGPEQQQALDTLSLLGRLLIYARGGGRE